jgi:hypothetical protein
MQQVERDVVSASLSHYEARKQRDRDERTQEKEKWNKDFAEATFPETELQKYLRKTVGEPETNYAHWTKHVGRADDARINAERRKLDDDIFRRTAMNDLYYANREAARKRQCQDMRKTLDMQVEEKKANEMASRAYVGLEKQRMIEEDRLAAHGDNEKIRSERARNAKLLHEHLGKQPAAPQLTTCLQASQFVEKPLGREVGSLASWMRGEPGEAAWGPRPQRHIAPPSPQVQSQTMYHSASAPCLGSQGAQPSESPPSVRPKRERGRRRVKAPGHWPDVASMTWSNGLTPQTLKAAKDAAQEREAAAAFARKKVVA